MMHQLDYSGIGPSLEARFNISDKTQEKADYMKSYIEGR